MYSEVELIEGNWVMECHSWPDGRRWDLIRSGSMTACLKEVYLVPWLVSDF